MMKSLLALGVLAAPLSAQTSVTIYNDGRVLVRREVPVAVPKGRSSHRVTLGALDPASLFPLDSGVAITRASYDGATDEGSALRRSVGRRVVFRLPESTDTLSAVVLGVDPLRLQLPDGRITFQPPGAAIYPAEVVVADPTAAIDLLSARERKTLRLGYFTGGATWQASYQVTIGGRTHGWPGLRCSSRRRSGPRTPRCSSSPARWDGRRRHPSRPNRWRGAWRRRTRWPTRPRPSSGWASSISTRFRARAPCSPVSPLRSRCSSRPRCRTSGPTRCAGWCPTGASCRSRARRARRRSR